ncbi:osmotically-inducible lipoprotein OsmE [Burkholderia pseudomallei]|uniref:outer membrane protein assembly factor BamE n=1 Tax=Burkholderia pseudomallei TaxID=28450 RepID=UPI000F04F9AC|nr:outer membrane protein assembly factor BamE [Burkholderia pseudomallei]CAJ3603774.1 osmotically-inducible lipoprotein OsmE [Burkholderia pseudomallei]CAJ7368093.1 osmotically-inducible lipoprotein OsmE [Burkholderia pseudomallei]VBI97675.1 osmotically-inducible lipoprotein OsmE [Burkholderia pseudomallei]
MSFQTTNRTVSALACPFAAALLMSGCSWLGGWFDSFSYARLPLPKAAAQPGATQAQIVKAGGNPASVWMVRNGAGVCYNYDLRQGNDHRPYYVVFDRRGIVSRHGFSTCAQADREGLLRGGARSTRDEPRA